MAACLASNSGSGLLPHQYSVLWGRSLPALRMRCTVVAERPLSCARSRTLQEVLPCRGVLVARSTTERRCAAVMLAGRPGRCSSASPSRRLSRKRRFHLKTLIWLSPHCSPTALMGSPCAQQRMTFARRESLGSVVPARVHMRRVCSSSAVSSIRRAVAMNSLLRCTECDHLMGLLYYNTLEECNTSAPPRRRARSRSARRYAVADGGELLHGEVEVGDLVQRRHLHANARLAVGHDRVEEADGVDGALEQPGRDQLGVARLANHDRDDRVARPARLEPRRLHRRAEVLRVAPQPRAQVLRPLHDLDGRDRSRRDHRRQAVREEVGARALPEQLDHLAGAAREAAAGAAERLAQRAGDDVDAFADAVVLRRAAPMLAQHAERVRVVDHDEGAVALGERADVREGRDDAVHGEHAVRHDQDGARTPRLLEPLLEVRHVAVAVAVALRLGEAIPSMMLAWFRASLMTASSGPRSVSKRPPAGPSSRGATACPPCAASVARRRCTPASRRPSRASSAWRPRSSTPPATTPTAASSRRSSGRRTRSSATP